MKEIEETPRDLRRYVIRSIQNLWETPSFQEALSGHLPPDAASEARLLGLRRGLRDIAALSAQCGREDAQFFRVRIVRD